jgi:hypothetical protein
MHIGDAISRFVNGLGNSPRIGTAHIGLYCVLLQYGFSHHGEQVRVTRDYLMSATKIGSPTTYFRLLKDLHTSGFILYRPSHHPHGATRISLVLPERTIELFVKSNTHEHEKKVD